MLLVSAVLFPIIFGILASYVKMPSEKNRKVLYAAVMIIFDALCVLSVCFGEPVLFLRISERVSMSFRIDGLGTVLLAAAALLYTAVCFYAFEYMKMEENVPRFFAFFFVSLGAMAAVCMAGDPVTMYLCFELATLSTVPLVLHEMSKEAVKAGLKYLFYSMAGALMGLFAVFVVYNFSSGSGAFSFGGFLDPQKTAGRESLLLWGAFAGIIGFGTKAGMYPMHGWLPAAHPIAPAPASALLSGIIAKAGAAAVIRLVFYCIGPDALRGTWVQYAWMCLAMLTVFMGSMMAFREKITKKRLAYSTVSQISYIMLALSFLSEDGLRGALLHLMSHSASKGCLFLVAGIFIYKLGVRNVSDLKGTGKLMPVTLWCFTAASLSLIGIPPLGGFLSKWEIAGAALSDGMGVLSYLPVVILLISALLTAGYLLPIVVEGFFPGEGFEPQFCVRGSKTLKDGKLTGCEPSALMTVPLIVLCAAALACGIFGEQILDALGF